MVTAEARHTGRKPDTIPLTIVESLFKGDTVFHYSAYLISVMSRYDGGPYAINVPMSISSTENKDLIVAYYTTHIVADKVKIIGPEVAQQSHDEVASHTWKAKQTEKITSSNVLDQ